MDVESTDYLDTLLPEVERQLHENYPDVLGYGSRFQLGPGRPGKIQARFSGPDRRVVRELSSRAKAILEAS